MNEKELTKTIKRLLRLSFGGCYDVETYYYFSDDLPYRIEVIFFREFVKKEYFDKFSMGIESHLGFFVNDWSVGENEVTLELLRKGENENV